MRKVPLENEEVYHVMSKSIAGYKIFNSEDDYQRMLNTLEYFSAAEILPKLSYFLKRAEDGMQTFERYFDNCFPDPQKQVRWIAYCLMPTHIHLIVQQIKKGGISTLMANALNSYTRYFNIKHRRKGPLWVGRFKSVHIESDEQLRHITRYVNLNPVTAHLVNKAEAWRFSSYHEYVTPSKIKRRLCEYEKLMNIKPRSYRNFVEDQAGYQRELAEIKHLILE